MPAATRVCTAARRAAARTLPAVTAAVSNTDPANIECRLQAGRTRLDLVAQASAQAWVEFDTTYSHQAQVFGPTNVHQTGELPVTVNGAGGAAVWVPALAELVATNGSQSTAGSYVTATVTGGPKSARLPLATTVVRAALRVAPKGPRPG